MGNTVEMAGGDINTVLCLINVNSNTIELTCNLLAIASLTKSVVLTKISKVVLLVLLEF